MSDITHILLHETSRIIIAGLSTDQIQGADIEMRIATVYDALRRATESGGVKDLPSFDRPSKLNDEEMREVDRVIDRAMLSADGGLISHG